MQKLTPTFAALRDMLSFLENEALKSPAFAKRLQAALAPAASPKPKARTRHKLAKTNAEQAGATIAAYRNLAPAGGNEFHAWLSALDVPALRVIIKHEGLDPSKVTRSWKNHGRLVSLIFDCTALRMRRGSAFLPPKANKAPPPPANSKAKARDT